jgi:hypothetical protein
VTRIYLFLISTLLISTGSDLYAACGGNKIIFDYPVVLKTSPLLEGVPINRLRALSKRGEMWRPIPIQIDEKNANGDYVLERGLPYTRNSDNKIFDNNDQISLSGINLGEPIGELEIPAWVNQEIDRKWIINFCSNENNIGSVLIVQIRENSKVANIKAPNALLLDLENFLIESEEYSYHFNKNHPALLGEVYLGRPKNRKKIIESSFFQMPLVTPWFLPNFILTENDFTSKIESWRSGPVRTIIAVGVKYEMFLGLFKLHLFTELVFYKNKLEIPTPVEFSFSPKDYLEPGSGIAYSLNFLENTAWEIETNLEKLPLEPNSGIVSGDLVEANSAALKLPFRLSARSPLGGVKIDVKMDERARQISVPPAFISRENYHKKTLISEWPWLANNPGDLGVYIDFAGLSKGIYKFGLDLILSSVANDNHMTYGYVNADWQSPL